MQSELHALIQYCDRNGYRSLPYSKRTDRMLGPELALHALRTGGCDFKDIPKWIFSPPECSRGIAMLMPYQSVPKMLKFDRSDPMYSYGLALSAVRDSVDNYRHLPWQFRCVSAGASAGRIFVEWAVNLVHEVEGRDDDSFYAHIIFGDQLLGAWSRDLATCLMLTAPPTSNVYRQISPALRHEDSDWAFCLAQQAVKNSIARNYPYVGEANARALGENCARRWVALNAATNEFVPPALWLQPAFAGFALAVNEDNQRYISAASLGEAQGAQRAGGRCAEEPLE